MTRKEFEKKHSKLTRSLKKFVLDCEKSLGPDMFQKFLNSLHDELDKALQALMSVPAGPERARKLHSLVEEEIEREKKIPVSCAKGCSACCHMEVEVTNFETEILLQRASERNLDLERLQIQGNRSLQDAAWKEGKRNQTNRCVFLGPDEACSIYADRPVMCRRHSVTSPALNCETPGSAISVRYFPRVDLLICAANEDPDLRIGPLAKMLGTQLLLKSRT